MITCNGDRTEYNKRIEELVAINGPRTRNAAVAVAFSTVFTVFRCWKTYRPGPGADSSSVSVRCGSDETFRIVLFKRYPLR